MIQPYSKLSYQLNANLRPAHLRDQFLRELFDLALYQDTSGNLYFDGPTGTERFDRSHYPFVVFMDKWNSTWDAEAVEAYKRKAEINAELWEEVRETWESESGIVSKVVQYAKSQVSRIVKGRVPLSVLNGRSLNCHGNRHYGGSIDPCSHRKFSPDRKYHWCDFCGCGERKSARLSAVGSTADNPVVEPRGDYTKLHYPFLAFPRSNECRNFSNPVIK